MILPPVVVLLYDTTGGFLFHLFFELEIRVVFLGFGQPYIQALLSKLGSLFSS
jgi:hypothetical protein